MKYVVYFEDVKASLTFGKCFSYFDGYESAADDLLIISLFNN